MGGLHLASQAGYDAPALGASGRRNYPIGPARPEIKEGNNALVGTRAGLSVLRGNGPHAPWVENPGTVVFCHGVSTTHGIWSTWLPVLADRYRLVRFDTRGFGRSTVPGAGFHWSLDLLVGDVMAVARAAGAETFHLVGESLGGTVALALAIAHGNALESLTVCSAAHRGGSIQRAGGWRAYIEEHGMESMVAHDDGPAFS